MTENVKLHLTANQLQTANQLRWNKTVLQVCMLTVETKNLVLKDDIFEHKHRKPGKRCSTVPKLYLDLHWYVNSLLLIKWKKNNVGKTL